MSWAWICAPSGGPAWVAETAGRTVGHIALTTQGPAVREGAMSLTRFFVCDAARGTGAGGTLLSAVEEYAGKAGLSLVLDVLDGSDSAIRLYEKHGWTRFDTVRADWTGPDGNHPVLHLYEL
ncbi:GNAT family N-acetyltransferase [Arthrobacter sp. APC 3897]|uniref:GNAT family N-acetyltransferase n=1 Tax=Arthrobacter sp. APC 3897 TaxID=3035204 RepID=UPI0025B62415|nr:GNAT family N-acetyltransferase [Arthrobacter sp. APC 3897]MDN3480923.1 GNAT family N-acetyltransferase [Arthrobacter sp. APC 3897]